MKAENGVMDIGGGYTARYAIFPMSGSLLNDGGADVDENGLYWVRHSILGMEILGPVLRVVPDEAPEVKP